MTLDRDHLQSVLRGLRRDTMPTFWTIAEEDPGGMVGGGGPTYLRDDPNPHHSTHEWNRHLAKKFASREEAENSEAWKQWGPYAPKFWIEEMNGVAYPRVSLTDEEMVEVLETLLDPTLIDNVEAIRKSERDRIASAMREAANMEIEE
jgi:hypothetical protein